MPRHARPLLIPIFAAALAALPQTARPCTDAGFGGDRGEVTVEWPADGAGDIPTNARILLRGAGVWGATLARELEITVTADGVPLDGALVALPGQREDAWWVPTAPLPAHAEIEVSGDFSALDEVLAHGFSTGAGPAAPAPSALAGLDVAACIRSVATEFGPCPDQCGCPPGRAEVLARADRVSVSAALPPDLTAQARLGVALTVGFGPSPEAAAAAPQTIYTDRALWSAVLDDPAADRGCATLRWLDTAGVVLAERTACADPAGACADPMPLPDVGIRDAGPPDAGPPDAGLPGADDGDGGCAASPGGDAPLGLLLLILPLIALARRRSPAR